jgi:hypothetical protein
MRFSLKPMTWWDASLNVVGRHLRHHQLRTFRFAYDVTLDEIAPSFWPSAPCVAGDVISLR